MIVHWAPTHMKEQVIVAFRFVSWHLSGYLVFVENIFPSIRSSIHTSTYSIYLLFLAAFSGVCLQQSLDKRQKGCQSITVICLF